MGITGLIPFLEKSTSKVHLKDLKGSTVAIDTYCWLHKGVFSCADKLIRNEDTNMYVTYCLKYVSMLLSYNIKPILVFDGRHLPAKALTEKRRRENREISRKRAAELLRLDRTAEAHSHMRRCIDVTHAMALKLIKECRLRNVDCIVAPYEADAQMAFLNKLDIAQYVITEDSDLTLFGCKKIIFKLDLSGNGILVESDKLYLSMGCRQEKYSFDKFRTMCILSGCDYLDSLPGIGLAKACKFVLMTEEDDMRRALPKIPQYLKKKNLQVDGDYVENFLKADATFKHMYVYHPLERRMQRLNELSVWNTEECHCSNAGELLENETAFQLALGNLNPFSLDVLDTWHPDHCQDFSNVKKTKHKSIWQSNFTPHKANDKKLPISSWAIQFKKINYSKMQDNEESDEGPEENEIVSMYNSPQPPKKKFCSDKEEITTPLQVTPTKKPYNPFPMVSPREKKPICDLLLKPSPRKLPPINPFARSIFKTTTSSSSTIEVRSRFFASNVSLAGEYPSEQSELIKEQTPTTTLPEQSNKEIIDKITRIEDITKQNNEKIIAFYDYKSPSPVRDSRIKSEPKESPLSSTGEATQSQITPSIDSGIGSLHNTAPESEIESQLSNNEVGVERLKDEIEDNDNVIELSDDEGRIKPTTKKATPKKLQPVKSRTLGLTKLKKSNSMTSKLPSSQTRLSMFGFQKKPSLK